MIYLKLCKGTNIYRKSQRYKMVIRNQSGNTVGRRHSLILGLGSFIQVRVLNQT